MKNVVKRLASKTSLAALTGVAFLTGSNAFAVISAEEQGVFDAISTKIADLTPAALAVLAVILGTFVGFKLLKKFVGASS